MLGSVAYHNLSRLERKTVFAAQFVGNGLAEAHIARYGAVEAVIFLDGFDAGLLDVVRGVEVGFANGEVDYVDALSLEFCAFLRHRQGLRYCKCFDAR